MKPKNRASSNRLVRHWRLRKKVIGTAARPRLSLYPSLQHLEAQLIDDYEQRTLFGVSSYDKGFKKASGLKKAGNVETAVVFGKYVAQLAKKKGFGKVVFDRCGFLYHGRIKAFADAARENGLEF